MSNTEDFSPSEADEALAEAPAEETTTSEDSHTSEVSIDAGTAPELSEETDLNTVIEPDQVLLDSHAIARSALAEITAAETIGNSTGVEVHEARVVTIFFECLLRGYPGWNWAATLTRIDEDSAPNVLEVELLPGEGAVIAPDWVPWSERLAQYRDTQAKQRASESEDAAELEDETEDEEFASSAVALTGAARGDDYDEDDFDDDDADDDDDAAITVDEDGFADLDEHDLHDDDDELLDDDDDDELAEGADEEE